MKKHTKSLLSIFAALLAALCVATTCLVGCAQRDVYIDKQHVVGTFGGYKVLLQKLMPYADVSDVITEYEAGGIYIASLPDPSWGYFVCESDDERTELDDAYNMGLISRSDIEDIAAAERQYYLGGQQGDNGLNDGQDGSEPDTPAPPAGEGENLGGDPQGGSEP